MTLVNLSASERESQRRSVWSRASLRPLHRCGFLLSVPRSYSALYPIVVLNVLLLALVVRTAYYYDVMGVETVIAKDAKRVRFTQMWSTGHVGTRFLTTLLQGPEFLDENFGWDHSSTYMAWNELELPRMKQIESHDGSKFIWVPFLDTSLHDFKAFVSNEESKRKGLGWYGGNKIKELNRLGDSAALRAYLEEERIPALRSVYERYNNQVDHPEEKLNHFIKAGHSSVFFDLDDYYEVLSSTSLDSQNTIDVDFVRIRRNRIEVANSFISDKGRMGPVESMKVAHAVVTNPNMKTALLRFASLGGPLPDMVYWNWTVFQKHLWFCDEIEARWRVFLKNHPEVRHYELSYTATGDDPYNQMLPPSSIDDLALNFLEIGYPLSPYIQKISKRSHVTNKTEVPRLTRKEKEEQAIEYSKQAPWCLQFEGGKINEQNTTALYNYPKLDCGLLA